MRNASFVLYVLSTIYEKLIIRNPTLIKKQRENLRSHLVIFSQVFLIMEKT